MWYRGEREKVETFYKFAQSSTNNQTIQISKFRKTKETVVTSISRYNLDSTASDAFKAAINNHGKSAQNVMLAFPDVFEEYSIQPLLLFCMFRF